MAFNDSQINGSIINGGLNLNLSQESTAIVGIIVEYPGVFTGNIIPTLSKINIHKSGSGFMEGNLFHIENNTATMLVKSCFQSGITAIEYVNFGFGNYDTFQQILYPSKTKKYAKAIASVSGGKVTNIQLLHNGEGYANPTTVTIVGNGKFAKATCTVSGGSITNVTLVEEGASYTHAPSVVFDNDVAVIEHVVGKYRKYPGYYLDSNSLISDESFIQDGLYYQTYSYEIEVDVLFEKYKNVIKRILHPSGYNLFGTLSKFDRKDIISAIKLIQLQIDQFPSDTVFAYDKLSYNFSKLINESTNPLLETIVKTISKPLEDNNVTVEDAIAVMRVLLLMDTATLVDSISKTTSKTFNSTTGNVIDSVLIPPFKTLIINDTNLRFHSINPAATYGTNLNTDYFADDYTEYPENFSKTL
jgi:hypothetical protein